MADAASADPASQKTAQPMTKENAASTLRDPVARRDRFAADVAVEVEVTWWSQFLCLVMKTPPGDRVGKTRWTA